MATLEESNEIWRRVSALEAHDCEVHKIMAEIKAEVRDMRDTKADLAAVKESTRLAKEVMDARLNSMNEFRSALSDQADDFLTRTEYTVQYQNLEQRFGRMDEDIRTLRESRAELQGKASQSQVNIALIVAIIGIAISVMGILAQGL